MKRNPKPETTKSDIVTWLRRVLLEDAPNAMIAGQFNPE